MPTGKVKFFSDEKGFGFIVPDEGGSDVFVHRSALNASGIDGLDADQPVQFDVVEDIKNSKVKAENLVIL